MIIVSHRAIREFSVQYPSLETVLEKWYRHVLKSDWSNFADLKQSFNSVDSVGNSLFVFNIAGNNCRLIARIIFRKRTVFIRFIGTHKQYDELDLDTL
jgi:mRNA interferase HigB